MKRRHSLLSLTFAATACLFFTAGIYAQRPQVPEMIIATLGGKVWKLSEHRGSVVIVNFWATWCAPCRTEVPYLIGLGNEFKGKGLEIAGVALDDEPAIVEKFVAEYKVDYPVVFPALDSPWRKLDNTPTTILIDRTGRLAKRFLGAVPEKELRAQTEALLAE